MKNILFAACLALFLATGTALAAEKVIPITDFSDYQGAYTGTEVESSFVVDLPLNGVPVREGKTALETIYNNNGNAWPWLSFTFPQGELDLTGMRELHIWVYFTPDTEGETKMNIQFAGIDFGDQTAPEKGKWCELVWKIGRIPSDTMISKINAIYGRFPSGDANKDAKGTVYIDKIWFVRPANIIDVEEVTLYGFNNDSKDDLGWAVTYDNLPDNFFLGKGETTPKEGDNYLELALVPSWKSYVVTKDVRSKFDRWEDVTEIILDFKTNEAYTESWGSIVLVMQSGPEDATAGTGGWDQYAGRAINTAKEWTTVSWDVNVARHAAAFVDKVDGSWGQFFIIVQTPDTMAATDAAMYIDNFRVAAKKKVAINDWTLF